LLSQVGMQPQPSAPPFWSILLARYTDGEQLRGVRYVGCIDRVKALAPISDLACGHSELLADDDMETPRRWLPGQERRGGSTENAHAGTVSLGAPPTTPKTKYWANRS
jgi:hypothetical protein